MQERERRKDGKTEGRKEGRRERETEGRREKTKREARHPERSEGSCRVEVQLRVRRSLAPLGMTVDAGGTFPFPLSLFPS
jgi:hypothetical protein